MLKQSVTDGIVALTLCAIADSALAIDYPTDVIADYVIACMASNGQTQEMLRRCSCSIDTIASILPYEEYEKAETILMMQQSNTREASMFKQMLALKKKVDALRLAQIEADFRCF
jgi:hypothetical protein